MSVFVRIRDWVWGRPERRAEEATTDAVSTDMAERVWATVSQEIHPEEGMFSDDETDRSVVIDRINE